MTQPDLVSKLREALTSINPFSGGRDGDECLWCRRDYPRDCKTMEEYFLPEHHQSDCQLILALLAEKQPAESLLGREGQAARCNYYFGGVDGGNRCQKAIHDADEGHEWRYDREGQVAEYASYRTENISSHPIPCGPSQPETVREGYKGICVCGHRSGAHHESDPSCEFCACKSYRDVSAWGDSPSTPIVPSTAGLSEIGIVKAILSAHQTAYAKFHNGEGRNVIESDGMAIGYASVELAKLLAGREAQIRKDVLEEAAQVVEKAFEQSWVVQDTLDAIRALAERPAPVGEVPPQADAKGINEAGICELCGHDAKEGEKLLGCVTIEHCCNLLNLEREWWHARFHKATGIPCDGTLTECKRVTPGWIWKARFASNAGEVKEEKS